MCETCIKSGLTSFGPKPHCSEAEHARILEEARRMHHVVVEGGEDDKLFAEEPSGPVVSGLGRYIWAVHLGRRAVHLVLHVWHAFPRHPCN